MIDITPEYLRSQGLSETFPKRFWSKVIKTDGCWIWTGAIDQGYGGIYHGMSKHAGKTNIRAHVASWILHFGPIPKGFCICHKCDVKTCCNPEHLFCATQGDNIRDAYKKGRIQHDPATLAGDRTPLAKLTWEQVHLIRSLWPNKCSQRQLAKRFHIARSNIFRIVHNMIWKECYAHT